MLKLHSMVPQKRDFITSGLCVKDRLDIPGLMDIQDLLFSLKHSPEQYINALFLYILLHSDDNHDNDGDDDDSDEVGDDDDGDSDGTDGGVSNVHDSENGNFSDESVV